MASLLEVFGLKKMMVGSMITLLIGIVLTFIMQQSWQLIIIWGIIIGLGSGLFLTVLSPYIANRWFEKKRGLVVGILTAATATGQLILLPILAIIIDHYSWRWAIGLIMILSFIMLSYPFIVYEKYTKEIGILPYGLEKERQESNENQKEKSYYDCLPRVIRSRKSERVLVISW